MKKDWPNFGDLLTAYKNCRLGKRASIHQTAFEKKLGDNLLKLYEEIHSGRYSPNPVVCFVITRPKPREIFAAHFRDRIVHHLVVSQLTPKWERKFIHSRFACRKEKGTHGAIRCLQSKARSLSRGGKLPVWVLQLDIASFFVTIHRPTLWELLCKEIRHSKLLGLVDTIYSHDNRIGAIRRGPKELFSLIPKEKSWFEQQPDQGIPIGNLASQFGANVYLTHLDHWICRTLKPGAYFRYMDDLTLLDLDPEKLQRMSEPIDDWLIEYLGYRVRQGPNPAEPAELLVSPKKKWEWISKVREFERSKFPHPDFSHPLAIPTRPKQIKSQLAKLNSRLGYLIHARSYRLRKESLDRLVDRTIEFLEIPEEFCIRRKRVQIKGGDQSITD